MFLFLALCTLSLASAEAPLSTSEQPMSKTDLVQPTPSKADLLSLRCFQWILDGSDRSYEEMTKGSTLFLRLQKQSFSSLHQLCCFILQNHPKLSKSQMQSLFEKALLMQRFERSEKFCTSFGIRVADSNHFQKKFLSLVKEKPALFPSFASLSEEEKTFLLDSYRFGNFAPIFYLEGGKEMFHPIKQKLSSQKNALLSLDFGLLVSLCTLSGESAHLNSTSSSALTEEAYLAFETTRESLHLLSLPKKQEEDAYLFCIEKRANQLHLELKKSSDLTLVRIAALLHLFSPHEAALLKEAFHALSYAERESILLQFKEKKAAESTPICLSSLLMTVFNDPSSGSCTKDKLKNTAARLLPLLSQILKDASERVGLGLLEPKIPLNFQKASQFAKEHPLDLPQASYQIDKEGQVSLFVAPESSKP